MKNLKNFARLLLAMVMLVCMTTTAFAATVSFPEDDILANHTFTAYQIFSGRQENNVLSDIKWGTGIDSGAFLAALKADDSYGDKFTDCDSAADVAEVLGVVDDDQNALALAVAKIAEDHVTGSGTVLTSGENTLAAGYYLVVDTTDTVLPGSAYNAALLEVVGDIEFEVKTDAPSVEK